MINTHKQYVQAMQQANMLEKAISKTKPKQRDRESFAKLSAIKHQMSMYSLSLK